MEPRGKHKANYSFAFY
ncbi:hypothetical protein Patl1_34129 [Pistacia atlantica]|uniref:Uncharacterized protein n=1 Tax=Pistacia atlantica TaxID=434234 RepID=A0ACC0ZX83_9ROSI|nr:hypothetical protein Patl1_34129 [Pistacia atlantica]